jgi:hypothetical protein
MIAMTRSDTFLGVLKDNDVRLISHVGIDECPR